MAQVVLELVGGVLNGRAEVVLRGLSLVVDVAKLVLLVRAGYPVLPRVLVGLTLVIIYFVYYVFVYRIRIHLIIIIIMWLIPISNLNPLEATSHKKN